MSLVKLTDPRGGILAVDPATITGVIAGFDPATSELHTIHGFLVTAQGTVADVVAVLRGAEPSAPSLREGPQP